MSVKTFIERERELGFSGLEREKEESCIVLSCLKGQRKQIILHLFVNKRIEVITDSTVGSY